MGGYRRLVVACVVALVLVGAYGAAGFLAVPYYARQLLQSFARTHYGRAVSVGAIRCNPFALTVDVMQLALPDADGQTLLSFRRLHLDLQLASLWRLGASFREILLEEPYVRAVIRPDGVLNLADLGKGLASARRGRLPGAAPLRLFIRRMAVIAGSSSFEDRTGPTPFHADFRPIAFELRDFSTSGATENDYALSAASPDGERLRWSGTLRLEPLASRGVFEITDLKARTVWNYLSERLPFEIDSGMIRLKGDYDLAGSDGTLGLKLNVRNATLSSLGVRPKGGAQNYLDVAHIEVEDTRLDLSRHTLEVAKVALSGGDVRAWTSEQGRLNLLDLWGAPPPAAASAGKAGAPVWRVSASAVTLQGCRVSAEDRRVRPAAALLLEPLNAHIAGVSTSPDDALDVTLDAHVNGSGRISARARVAPRSAAVSAHLEATDLALTTLQPYLARYTSLTLLQGTLEAGLDIERRADGMLALSGGARVADLRAVDNALQQDLIKWKDLRIADLSYLSRPASLRIGSIAALEPYVRMTVEADRTLNILHVLQPGTAAGLAAPASIPRLPVSIGTIRFINGSANYADLWIKPSFAIGIQTLGGTVTGLSSDPRSRAKVQLEGEVDRYSPTRISGEVNLLSVPLYSDVRMSFSDLDLTVVNPYAGHFAGYRIDKGKLSVDVSYRIEQHRLTAAQHFLVDQLELGDRVDSPYAVHVPLKLALALLKDRNGVIDLDLPMSGALDDPAFRIGPVMWRMFTSLITKVATAPFAFLGHQLGGSEHMNIVEFQPGSTALDAGAKEALAALVRALRERPQLALNVPIVFSARLDRPQIAATRLREELLAHVRDTRQGRQQPQTAGEQALADPERHFRLLVEQYQADFGKDTPLPPTAVAVQQTRGRQTPPYDPAIADLSAALIDVVAVPEGELEALGRQRAQAIQAALLADGQVEAGRVFIVNAPPRPESGNTVKVELTLR